MEALSFTVNAVRNPPGGSADTLQQMVEAAMKVGSDAFHAMESAQRKYAPTVAIRLTNGAIVTSVAGRTAVATAAQGISLDQLEFLKEWTEILYNGAMLAFANPGVELTRTLGLGPQQKPALSEKTKHAIALLRQWRTNPSPHNETAYEYLINALKKERES